MTDGIVLLVSGGVSALLLHNLWGKHPHDSPSKKVFWSVVVLIPVFGWVLYGCLYDPPSRNRKRPKADASGWAPQYKDL